MKIMKKTLTLILSMVMMLAMSIAAFADETTFNITAPATNHQYEIYQIFTGDVSGGVLVNEKWGTNSKGGTKGEAVSEEVLSELKAANSKSDTEKLAVIKKYVDLTTTPVGTVTNGSSCAVAPGYYLIKDKDYTDSDDTTGIDSYTLYLVKVVDENTTITPKADVPSFEKKIKDTNDTTGATSDWQDSADYDIGDQVPFKLEGTVASNYADYKTYYFAFHDKEEEGLTFNSSSVKVYVDGKEIKTNYTVETNPTDGCTFEVVFNNLKDIKDSEGNALVQAGSKITIEYTSRLNEKAALGQPGNVNSAKLEYSNNPNNEQVGKPDKPGETPWDNVIVFTYKVVVNKVDESGNALSGAGFTLWKIVDGEKVEVKKIEAKDGVTSFEFKGLDDGDYVLEETTVPAGYNKMADIEFTVTAEHKIVWDGENRDSVLTNLSGSVTNGNITFTSNKSDGELSTAVVNKKGVELPSTGGIGTTIFYVVGGVLMAAAAILLITKKRMTLEK